MIKVSIIVPVYNVEKYLRQCLDSLINQTLKDIEIICVNDGSKDSSLSILEEYFKKDNRIKIINQENKGLSGARNTGLDIAKGEYIGFVDSDDYIDLDFCEKLYKRAQETQADVVVCEKIIRFKDNKKQTKKLFLQVDKSVVTNKPEEKFKLLYLPDFCYVQNKIYKNEKLKDRFMEGLKWEDVYFTTNALLHLDKLAVAQNCAYYYRDTPNSIVNTVNKENQYYFFKAFAYFYKFLIDNNINIETKDNFKIKRFKFLGLTIFKVKRKHFSLRYKIFNIFGFKVVDFKHFL